MTSKTYEEELEKQLFQATGLRLGDSGLQRCLNSQNNTVTDCPVNSKVNKDKIEFIVIVHNQANIPNK